jgi:hypothetical protein
MGKKPVIAASAAISESTSLDNTLTTSGRFGMPHATVITVVVVTAAFLAPDGMSVQEVLMLLAGAGVIGAAVVGLAVTGGRGGGRVGRFVRAYFNSGN